MAWQYVMDDLDLNAVDVSDPACHIWIDNSNCFPGPSSEILFSGADCPDKACSQESILWAGDFNPGKTFMVYVTSKDARYACPTLVAQGV